MIYSNPQEGWHTHNLLYSGLIKKVFLVFLFAFFFLFASVFGRQGGGMSLLGTWSLLSPKRAGHTRCATAEPSFSFLSSSLRCTTSGSFGVNSTFLQTADICLNPNAVIRDVTDPSSKSLIRRSLLSFKLVVNLLMRKGAKNKYCIKLLASSLKAEDGGQLRALG